jgi:hypothetical protein
MILTLIWLWVWGVNTGHSLINTNEVYHVVYVNGVIINASNQQALKVGAKLNASDKLIFKTADARARVISSTKGSCLLASKKQGGNTELGQFLADVIIPLKKNNALSTRASSEIIDNVKNYFGDSTFNIVGEKLEIGINTEVNQISDTKILALLCHHQDTKKTYLKRISFANMVRISQLDVFQSKGIKFNMDEIEKFEICWFYPATKTHETITTIQLNFIAEPDLKGMFQEISTLKTAEIPLGEEKIKYFQDYFMEMFGRTDERLLKKWLITNQF